MSLGISNCDNQSRLLQVLNSESEAESEEDNLLVERHFVQFGGCHCCLQFGLQLAQMVESTVPLLVLLMDQTDKVWLLPLICINDKKHLALKLGGCVFL